MPNHSSQETEALEAALLANDTLSLKELAFHLGVDRDTAAAITRDRGLDLGTARCPWGRIWRRLHKVEPSRLPAHLADLKERDLPGLEAVEDLERALRRQLLDFGRMARALGSKPDTLSKAVRQGRVTLPFPAIVLGKRLRRYRPLEVELWRDHELLLGLPAPIAVAGDGDAAETAEAGGDAIASTAEQEIRKAVFGSFAANKRKNAA